jgi:ActR/RegA family two-component response regulator
LRSTAEKKADDEARQLRDARWRHLAERFERMLRDCVPKAEAARRLGVNKRTAERALRTVKGGKE